MLKVIIKLENDKLVNIDLDIYSIGNVKSFSKYIININKWLKLSHYNNQNNLILKRINILVSM